MISPTSPSLPSSSAWAGRLDRTAVRGTHEAHTETDLSLSGTARHRLDPLAGQLQCRGVVAGRQQRFQSPVGRLLANLGRDRGLFQNVEARAAGRHVAAACLAQSQSDQSTSTPDRAQSQRLAVQLLVVLDAEHAAKRVAGLNDRVPGLSLIGLYASQVIVRPGGEVRGASGNGLESSQLVLFDRSRILIGDRVDFALQLFQRRVQLLLALVELGRDPRQDIGRFLPRCRIVRCGEPLADQLLGPLVVGLQQHHFQRGRFGCGKLLHELADSPQQIVVLRFVRRTGDQLRSVEVRRANRVRVALSGVRRLFHELLDVQNLQFHQAESREELFESRFRILRRGSAQGLHGPRRPGQREDQDRGELHQNIRRPAPV